jgi:gamma-glutamyl phosphate reductase
MGIIVGMTISDRARTARDAGRLILSRGPESRSAALRAVRAALEDRSKEIFDANRIDMERLSRRRPGCAHAQTIEVR